MFELSGDHMQRFSEMRIESFEDRAVEHLRQCLGHEVDDQSDDQLRERVHRSMKRSELYGLTNERQIMCFVDSGVLVGEYFDLDPAQTWAAHILRHPTASPDHKAAAILHIATEVRKDQLRMLAMVPPEQRASFFVPIDLDEFAEEQRRS